MNAICFCPLFQKNWEAPLIIWPIFSSEINTLSNDKELSKNSSPDTLEKQTFFSSQYTEPVTEYGGWRCSFYRPESHF